MGKIDLLQDIQIKKAKAEDKEYFLNDGGGLRIGIKPNGSKVWEFRYTINGQRKKTSFKTYPTLSLKEARTKRQEYQTLINNGIDPITNTRQIKEENIIDTKGMFVNVAAEWLNKESEKTLESTHKNKIRVFEKDINPFLKDKHIKDFLQNLRRDKVSKRSLNRKLSSIKSYFRFLHKKNYRSFLIRRKWK